MSNSASEALALVGTALDALVTLAEKNLKLIPLPPFAKAIGPAFGALAGVAEATTGDIPGGPAGALLMAAAGIAGGISYTTASKGVLEIMQTHSY